jgi:protocatechuate 3,4-dioxygenase beta subunit
MNVRQCFSFILIFSLLQFCVTLAQTQTAASQNASGALRGQVSDPSGAAIANASVVLTPAAAGSTPIKTQANGQGQYEFKGLAPGQYTLNAVAQGF